jgi:hypothetical protein
MHCLKFELHQTLKLVLHINVEGIKNTQELPQEQYKQTKSIQAPTRNESLHIC